MAKFEVSDKVAAELRELAVRDDRAVQDLLTEAVSTYVSFRHLEPALTPSQVERLRHSVAQGDRGDLVSQEAVEGFFDDWEREIASR